MITKIITHNGRFHADEVFAIALLKIVLKNKTIEIIRKSKVEKYELEDLKICVVDIGAAYAPDLNNFDHHHDLSLASAVYLVALKFLNPDFFKHMHPFLSEISDIDNGKMKSSPTMLNTIIGAFNPLENGFYQAIEFATIVIERLINTADLDIKSELIWKTQVNKDGIFAIYSGIEEIFNWRKFAERDGIFYMICPNREKGSFGIISIDSNSHKIPEHNSQTFRHHSGFIAVYPSLIKASEHAQEIKNSYQEIKNSYFP